MTAHAKLSASGAAKWLACPPSVKLEENFPDTGSVYAAEGTLAHSVAELKVRKYAVEPMSTRTFNTRLNKLKKHELWQPEMDGYTDEYLDYIKAEMLAYTTKPFVTVERRVDFSDVVPGGFGTADCLILAGNVLHVIDFKYGKGVLVEAESNPQMRLYAYGAVRAYALLYSFDTVKMTIFQPRLKNISEAEISVDDLRHWAQEEVKPVALLADKGEGEYNPGPHCKFCRAKAECKARAEACMALVPAAEDWQEKSKGTVKAAGLYTPEELAEYLKKGALLKDWYSDICEHALTLCLNGVDVPGYKAVNGRNSREFSDLDAAFGVLTANGVDEAVLYERRPLTLAQAEKVVGAKTFKELVGGYILTKPGKPTLVPASDKRQAITNDVKAADVFTKI